MGRGSHFVAERPTLPSKTTALEDHPSRAVSSLGQGRGEWSPAVPSRKDFPLIRGR